MNEAENQNCDGSMKATPQTDGSYSCRPPYRSQKFVRRLAFGVVACALAVGCVPSLHPFYKRGETQFAPELVGTWDAKTGPIRGRWKFSRYRNEASYRLEFTTDDNKTDVFRGHLFEVGDRRYLDLYLSEYNEEFKQLSEFAKLHLSSFHTVAQLSLKDDALMIAFLDSRWIQQKLRNEPTALRHVRRTRVVLTASTEELHAFIKKHADDPSAWNHKVRLIRQSPREAAPREKRNSKGEVTNGQH